MGNESSPEIKKEIENNKKKEEEENKKKEEEKKKREEEEEKVLEKMRQERRKKREELRKQQLETKKKKEFEEKNRIENEKKEISKIENIKNESKEIHLKEEKNIDKNNENETNKINKNNQNIFNNNRYSKNRDTKKNQVKYSNKCLKSDNRKYTHNLKHKKNYESFSRYENKYLTNNVNNLNQKIETGRSVALDDKNVIKNKMENEQKKEKKNIDSMKNSDLVSDYDFAEKKIRFSIMPTFNKSNDKNIMINNNEEEIIFYNDIKKENDNKMEPVIKRNDSFYIPNKIKKNIINKDKEIININEIYKEDEIKMNEIKIDDKIEIKENKKNEIKENKNNEIKENKNNEKNVNKIIQNFDNKNNQNVDNKNEENKININHNLNNNYNDNLNINQILLNNEFKNEFLNDNNNSKNNININSNKNDDIFATNEFLRINFNLNTNDIYNYMTQLQDNNIENNENIGNIENNENIIYNENQEDLSNSPNYFSVLQNINIFNSVLIIFNNISFVIDYFSSDIEYVIQSCQLNNTYCLTSITYFMNKYLWKADGYLYISENDLIEKYQEYISRYIQFNNLNNSIPQNYCYDPRNTRNIYKSIYKMISNELTRVNGPKMNNYNNYDFKLSRYLNEINKTCNSILSENLMGFYRYQTYCEYCMSKAKKSGFIYNYEYEYKAFYEITFNLSEINYYYTIKNSPQLQNKVGFINNFNYFNNMNNEKQNIYLDQCLDYTFVERNKKTIVEYCGNCYLNSNKSQYNLIYSPPNVLTIILTNNEYNENCNFIFQDELNIKKYILNSTNDRIYLLISCICRLNNNGKYICYCINPKDSYWYSYSDEKINKVEEIDEDAVPLILFYQSINTMTFEYKKIMIINKLNEICLTVKFNNGMQPKNISFNRELTIKKVIEKILSTINLLGAKGKLSINGERALENDPLSKYLQEYNNVLLMISK